LKSAIENSDGIIKASEDLSNEISEFVQAQNKPSLEFQSEDTFADAYLDFYTNEVLD
jgi:starch synthase